MSDSKNRYFMETEIFSQPNLIDSSINNRISFDNSTLLFPEIENSKLNVLSISRIIFTGMGTSYNAALYGAKVMEEIAKIPSIALNASEISSDNFFSNDEILLVSITQSGESSDTVEMMKKARSNGVLQILVSESNKSKACNISDIYLPINSGIEHSIAATKTFTMSLLLLLQLSIFFAEKKSIFISHYIKEIKKIPLGLADFINDKKVINNIKEISKYISNYNNIFYLGRGKLFPVVLEGSLKLKETSYIHSEGYISEELRHGTFALLDKNIPVIICATDDENYEKNLSMIKDLVSLKSPVIAILNKGEKKLSKMTNKTLFIPKSSNISIPFFSTLVFQLLAYYVSLKLGNNPDLPRNLSKIIKNS